MPTKLINGAQIYYEEYGSGKETIVFSHGLLWSCRMFDKQVEELKDHYKVVAYDHRGQGQSEKTKEKLDMDSLSLDAKELIESISSQPVHFAGLSMGGFVGLRLASRYPELIKSLILIESSAEPEPKENLKKYKLLNIISRWLGFSLSSNSVMKILFGQSFLNDASRKNEKDTWKKYLTSNDRKTIGKAVNGVINRKGVVEELSNIKCPTLILIGEEDIATEPVKSKLMNEKIKGSKLVFIPRAGHSSSVEEPEEVNKSIKEFLGTIN